MTPWITGDDVQQMTGILASKGVGERGLANHCPECGSVSSEGANYCQKRRALIHVLALYSETAENRPPPRHGDGIGRRAQRLA